MRRIVQLGLGMSLGFLMLACASPELIAANQPTMVQTLPIGAEFQVSGNTIQLEVARTPEQQEIGLMNRTSLEANRGMLFPVTPPRPIQFWMKNTLIPLDMIFLLRGEVKAIIPNVPPCTADPCPAYGPDGLVDQVIELRGGRAAELGIKAGDRLPLRFLN
jgi:uncharacterized membrane protein (UPF0127 family)